ncbi:uncharacterized protein LOC135465507 [Liolophura sinensis]|uniref:uncharacterized protein LOC135465507 n=1 Tax=Liolophura sinensis TaxID=3198878 RepID=UPI0031583C13
MVLAVMPLLSADNSTESFLGWSDNNDTVINTTPLWALSDPFRQNETDSSRIYSWTTENGTNATDSISQVNDTDSMTDGNTGAQEHFLTPPIPKLDYEFNLAATNRFLATDITKYICGSGRLCNQTQTPDSGHCIAECMPCQCDEMCHFYGDCCPDLLFSDSPHFPSTPFSYVSCSKEYWTIWGNLSDLFMVSSCPAVTDPIIADKCERHDKNDQDQATPVSVLNSQITYRNKFCAQCHDVPDAQAWRHHVACRTNNALNTAKSKADLWRRVLADEWCEVESYPPDGVTPRECYHSKVNTCKENSDPVIENLCLSFKNTLHYYGEDASYTSYRNIFCAACNGERLSKSMGCTRVLSPFIPLPLNVLLDFNPKSGQPQTAGKEIRMCDRDKVFDPFSDKCRNITCSDGSSLKDGICKEIVERGDFIGYLFDVTLSPVNSSARIPQISLFMRQYLTTIQEQLMDFPGSLVTLLTVSFYIGKDEKYEMTELGELVTVSGEIFTHGQANSTELEKTLSNVLSQDFSFNVSRELIPLLSRPYFCPRPFERPTGMKLQTNISEDFSMSIEKFPKCHRSECFVNVTYQTIPLNCPFVEYSDRFEENFTFDPLTYTLEFENYSFSLNLNEFRCCGRVLRICVDTIANITQVIFGDKTDPVRDAQDMALSIVSLICISSSLVGLLLTFLTYCAIPKLRTLPGKNSMALVFHLFCSHLLFLTTSNRTTNVVLCQVFGVLLHYFWIASFTWMLVSAYHMYNVFTSVRAYVGDSKRDLKRLMMYTLCSIFVPMITITSCLVTHTVQSQGRDLGYGGTICFLHSPLAIGVFFIGPLGLILVLNAIFFTKTILVIRSVPDMTEASNKSKKQHVFVYIKLSLLFGFTWIFGILAAILQSTVLEYVFTVLTGSQGVMIFLAYCVNERTWTELKSRVSGDKAFPSSMTSRARYTTSTDTTL